MLNPHSPIPLYFQLEELLKSDIISGRLQPGDQLPPERDLAEQYAISRMTARQALQELEQEGYLTRQSGRGTFVTLPSSSVRLSSLGFTKDIEARGMRPGGRVLSLVGEPAPANIAYELGLVQGAPVVRLERLRLADGEPIAHHVVYLSAERFPDLVRADLDNRSLYEYLNVNYGVVPKGGRRTVSSVAASPREAELLGVAVGVPLLRLDGVTLDVDGRAVELGWNVYRADRFRLTVEMT